MNKYHSIRVLIADDHAIVRQGLVSLLQQEPDLSVVGQARNGQEAVKMFNQHQPDVVLMDLRMPQMDGIEAITAIRAGCTNPQIVVLTTYDGDEDIYRGLQAGAKGYLLKDTEPDELFAAIRTVFVGKKYIPSPVGAKLAERMENCQLSDRELQVIRLIVAGKSNQQISDILHISKSTVKFHVNNILSKLNVNDRTQAAIAALKRGIASL
ncbi:MAG: response regulator transcription factor [Limnoraphis robusta]|uniref:LuxR family transcriptional regulator n=2 Tax=Limnoraphis robusta TaxID=1118279 RepID=A0A0F5YL11_9CYAN|nr:response regulator transcription factor [Limnoraphis robusta]KKD39584.1 LuxR family transcriptional regulator [Limnoraphis robusta CS-951]MEA5500675.1 response regulator transcription factor [Limnoraphis robusta BA-68 BA1]MEA5518867.1 response regulator transcription factor [Limnoraphis robusta CCNP1315]MEA5548374.1 response regulator transcription factor [Limnoraphis robusta CCNP1324]